MKESPQPHRKYELDPEIDHYITGPMYIVHISMGNVKSYAQN